MPLAYCAGAQDRIHLLTKSFDRRISMYIPEFSRGSSGAQGTALENLPGSEHPNKRILVSLKISLPTVLVLSIVNFWVVGELAIALLERGASVSGEDIVSREYHET